MLCFSLCFFFNDTATTEIYTLSLHDALPIYLQVDTADGGRHLPGDGAGDDHQVRLARRGAEDLSAEAGEVVARGGGGDHLRSEEHTSELQSRQYLVCRLLLEKKKTHM